jgi:hypothetical protein
MRYFPTIELDDQTKMLLARGALRLQPGQWVRSERGVGRYLRTDRRKGVHYVSWVRPEDDFTSHAQRFQRACEKGFVGKYAARYEAVKAEREALRAAARESADPADSMRG